MQIRRATIVALAVLPFGTVQPAQAAAEALAPPFDSVDHESSCSIGTGTLLGRLPGSGTCSDTSDATEDGLLSIDLFLSTEGPLPESGGAYGDASVRVFDWLDDASIVLYTVTYDVTGAHAVADQQGYLPLVTYGGYAGVSLSGSASLHENESSSASFYHDLADTYSEEEPAAGTFTRRMVLVSQDGSLMDGPVSLYFGLWSSAQMGSTTTGSAAAGATVQITSVTAEVIA